MSRIDLLQRFAMGRAWPRLCLLMVCLLLAGPRASGAPGAFQESGVKGVSFLRYTKPQLSISVIRIDRTQKNLEFATTLGGGSMLGLGTLSDQIQSLGQEGGRVVAAINGDFFQTERGSFPGDPRGLQITRGGEMVSGPTSRTAVWVDTAGNLQTGEVSPAFAVTWPSGAQTAFRLNEERSGSDAVLYTAAIGPSTGTSGGVELVLEAVETNRWLPLKIGQKIPAKVREIKRTGDTRVTRDTMVLSLSQPAFNRGGAKTAVGDVVWISTATTPDLKGATAAIGGGPALVSKGQVQPIDVDKGYEKHPRSAIGWNAKEVFLVVADGRQGGYSMGLNLPDMASFMLYLGCEEAMNLDGGGSTELWLTGRIANRPCYKRERETANSLIVVEQNPTEKP